MYANMSHLSLSCMVVIQELEEEADETLSRLQFDARRSKSSQRGGVSEKRVPATAPAPARGGAPTEYALLRGETSVSMHIFLFFPPSLHLF
jgi:hypothetical protein